jgi:deazaflavin-dependent oxidoreductase (nitroreductase family)
MPSDANPIQMRTDAVVARLGGALLRTRWLMRVPIAIYRARLGVVFGSRLLLLEHVGRRSGARRHVVLEVVDHPAPNSYIVASGFGTRAQWYRNLIANPSVTVQVASHAPTPATARVLTEHEAAASLRSYSHRHRWAWKRFSPILENTLGASVSEMPMIALELNRRSVEGRSTHGSAAAAD